MFAQLFDEKFALCAERKETLILKAFNSTKMSFALREF
jgi:hypothetical protein